MSRHAAQIIAGLSVLAAGCQGDPHASEYARGEVAISDLVGRWEANEGLESTLDLEADGSVYATDFRFVDPDRPIPDVGPPVPMMGQWTLRMGPYGWWTVAFQLECCDQGGSGRFEVAQVRGESPPDTLHFILGDPSQGKAITYRKVGPIRTPSLP